MKDPVEQFYDDFARHFVRDYIWGNRRVERQLAFLRASVPSTARRVLIIGCGSGESARVVAKALRSDAEIVAADISGTNVRLAEALNRHTRVRYTQLDILKDQIEGPFDLVILPDLYEHIPLAMRQTLHLKLHAILAAESDVLLTVPSPAKQATLRATGAGLQIVDEDVTVSDLVCLAADLGGELTYLNFISVWAAYDYIHAIISKGPIRQGSIDSSIPLSRYATVRGRAGRVAQRLRDSRLIRLLRAPFRFARLRLYLITARRTPDEGTRP